MNFIGAFWVDEEGRASLIPHSIPPGTVVSEPIDFFKGKQINLGPLDSRDLILFFWKDGPLMYKIPQTLNTFNYHRIVKSLVKVDGFPSNFLLEGCPFDV
jgi:hypothetical protein